MYLSFLADLVRGVWWRLVPRSVCESLACALQPVQRILRSLSHFLYVSVSQVSILYISSSENNKNL